MQMVHYVVLLRLHLSISAMAISGLFFVLFVVRILERQIRHQER